MYIHTYMHTYIHIYICASILLVHIDRLQLPSPVLLHSLEAWTALRLNRVSVAWQIKQLSAGGVLGLRSGIDMPALS